MIRDCFLIWLAGVATVCVLVIPSLAQGPPPGGGPTERSRTLIPQFDKDNDGRLSPSERVEARKWVKENPVRRGPGGRGRGGPGGRRGGPSRSAEPQTDPQPGEKLAPGDVESFRKASFYDPKVMRTIFVEFPGDDWEDELADFYRSDVMVTGEVTVDGKEYEGVGFEFRGNSSFFTVGKGRKRSLNVSVDHTDEKQRLYGYKTLNLLNAHADPSFIREALFCHVARHYIPAPKVNFARLVINGESWGVYVNLQQFNKDFLDEWFDTRDGVRWKVPAGRNAGGLVYRGDDHAEYSGYQLKTSGAEGALDRLIHLCETLDEASESELIEKVTPILNIDRALWFLALDSVFQDSDGYLSRGSDFVMYEDPSCRFHMLPYDSNETFRPAGGGGPGFGRRGGGGGPDREPRGEGGRPPGGRDGRPPGGPGSRRVGAPPKFDASPLVAADDERTPLASRLLGNPELKARYLAHVRTIVDEWLSWEKLAPVAENFRAVIREEINKDTRKLSSTGDFENSLEKEASGGRRPVPGIKTFVEERRKYLLSLDELKTPAPEIVSVERDAESEPKPGEPVTFEVKFGGDSAAKPERLFVHYSTADFRPFQALELKLNSAIPGQPAGTKVRYYVEARAADGTTAFFPRAAEHRPLEYQVALEPAPGSTLVINEVVADNSTGHSDPQGDKDDWIELHNSGKTDIDLSGFALSDNRANLRKWQFPEGTTIPAGGYLIVWADEDGKAKGGLHASFKLSKKGETITLSNKEGALLDVVTFGKQKADAAYSRDRDGKWKSSPLPSPAKANGE